MEHINYSKYVSNTFFSLGKNDSALEIHDLDLTLEIQRYFYDLQIMKRFLTTYIFNDFWTYKKHALFASI